MIVARDLRTLDHRKPKSDATRNANDEPGSSSGRTASIYRR